MNQWLHLLGAPPGWFPASAFGRTSHLFQPPEDPLPGHPDAITWSPSADRTKALVYVSLGTKFNRTQGAFETVFQALADEPVDVLATVGPGMDAGSFGRLPSNVTVAHFIPQALVIPHADVVICHAGYGSVMSALRAGKPVVARPLGNADGPANARRIEAIGVGKAITDGDPTSGAVRDAVRSVLDDPRFRSAAAQVAKATRELPGLAEAAALIKKLAASRTPVYSARG